MSNNEVVDNIDDNAPLNEQIMGMLLFMDSEIPRHIPPPNPDLFAGGTHGNYTVYLMFNRDEWCIGYNAGDHGLFEEDLKERAIRFIEDNGIPKGVRLLTPNNEGYDTISLYFEMDSETPLKDVEGLDKTVTERLELLDKIVAYIFNKDKA